jgi:superfamily II DNA or RNA helicase
VGKGCGVTAVPYSAFLESKRIVAEPCGLAIPKSSLNRKLFAWQRDVTAWALRRGRAALWEDCGCGKTFQQLEWAKHVSRKEKRPVLVVTPLAVAEQTQEEGERFGIKTRICQSQEDVRAGVNISNYQKLHKFTPDFAGIVLDESSILKSFDGKTRKALAEFASGIPYRLCCSATPAPNDYMELGNHAEFLGIMSAAEMLATFFVHDGGETQKWRLKGHAEGEFWKWLASWAVMLRKPSDLGYSDEGFNLPALEILQHVVETDASELTTLFPVEASTLQERRQARAGSLSDRVKKCGELIFPRLDEKWLVWCNLNAEQDALAGLFLDDAVSISGATGESQRIEMDRAWREGPVPILISKPSIFGYGMNYQHCHNVVFLGLSDSYEQFYQAVRRCWRFGQKSAVECHVITAETEGAVVRNIERKEKQAQGMADGMVKHMSGINQENIKGAAREEKPYAPDIAFGEGWSAILGDCVQALQGVAESSVDYVIYSPPFSSLYVYSNSERDMGNSRGLPEFLEHYRYCVAELFRTLKPGRLLSFHCMNLPTSKQFHGYIGVQDFRGDLIRIHQEAGFIYHSEVCIWKDPVTAMQRTKALGLLYKQLKKDSAMSRQGIPDYLVTMRKPGENPNPVTKTEDGFPCSLWQRYASPVWMDINPSDTLQRESAREEKDEKHIAPLQLEVIRRAIHLWTNPKDLVMSPFGGIGSEGYVAVQMGRHACIVELKRSYWEQACRNLKSAESMAEQTGLFHSEAE